MHHHDRHVLIAIRRDLILHVHLVDRDVASAQRAPRPPDPAPPAEWVLTTFFSPPTKKLLLPRQARAAS